MVVFYAFCRTLDDLADAPGVPDEHRRLLLDSWRHGLLHGFDKPTTLQQQVLALRDRGAFPTSCLTAIIDGCRMDLQPQRFQTWEDLSAYVWQVACAVGLVSIRLFGCTDPRSERYAVALGRALQLTNILRDLREDLANGGRIYLPLEDLARFDYSDKDLAAGTRDERFLALMAFEAERAEGFFREAAAALPASRSPGAGTGPDHGRNLSPFAGPHAAATASGCLKNATGSPRAANWRFSPSIWLQAGSKSNTPPFTHVTHPCPNPS